MRKDFILRGNAHVLVSSLFVLLLLSSFGFATTDAPEIIMTFPTSGITNSSNDINFGYIFTDDSAILTSNVTLWANFSGTLKANKSTTSITNKTESTLLVSDLPDGTYIWFWNSTDDAGNKNMTQTGDGTVLNYTLTIHATAPEITIHSPLEFASVFGNFTLNATIIDKGSSLITPLNITFLLFNETSNYSKLAEESYTNFTIHPDNDSRFNDTINSAFFADGQYTLLVNATDSVGNWNFESRNITINNSVFNVTVLNVTFSNTSISNPSVNPNQNLTINVFVNYGNGTPLSRLDYTNFTVYDNGTEILNTSAFVDYGSGKYSFNITSINITSGDTKPATHSISVYVEKGSYIGTSDSGKYYDLTVPYVTLTFNDLISSIDLNSATTDIFNITIRNNGTVEAKGIHVALSATSGASLSSSSCSIISSLPAESPNTSACGNITITLSSTGTKTITATASYYNGNNYIITTTSHQISVTDTSSSGDDDDSGDGNSGSLSPEGSPTYNYELSIDSYPTSVEIEQGKTKDVLVKVKNIGNKTLQDVKVKIKGVDWTHNWYTVSPSEKDNLLETDSQSFIVTIKTKNDTKIDSYSMTITMSATSATDKTKTFTLKVVPSQNTQSNLNESISELDLNITSLKRDVEYLIKKANNTNITLISEKYDKLKTLINESKTAISEGDYFTAAQNEGEIKMLLGQLAPLVDSEKRKVSGITGRITGAVSGAGMILLTLSLVAVLAYVLAPLYMSKIGEATASTTAGGYSTQQGFKFSPKRSEEESISRKIRKLVKELLEKLKTKKKEQQTKVTYNFGKNNSWS